MLDIPKTRPAVFLGSEFNNFLYERIGSECWDKQVSVVSALARLDVDPWVEADRLSRLTDESAAGSLSAMLSRVPELTLGIAVRQQVARRLVQLLPKQIPKKPAKNAIRRDAGHLLPWLIVAGLLCAFPLVLAGQSLWQAHYGASARSVNPAAASHIAAPALTLRNGSG